MKTKFSEHIQELERILRRKLSAEMIAALAVEWEVGRYGDASWDQVAKRVEEVNDLN